MTYAVYLNGEGYIGDVTAPTRDKAVEFLREQGYEPDSYDLRELNQ